MCSTQARHAALLAARVVNLRGICIANRQGPPSHTLHPCALRGFASTKVRKDLDRNNPDVFETLIEVLEEQTEPKSADELWELVSKHPNLHQLQRKKEMKYFLGRLKKDNYIATSNPKDKAAFGYYLLKLPKWLIKKRESGL